MGLALTGRTCDKAACGGALRDKTLDWDSALPDVETARSERAHRAADLVICLGTSLRIRPAGNFPARALRLNGKEERTSRALSGRVCVCASFECALRLS